MKIGGRPPCASVPVCAKNMDIAKSRAQFLEVLKDGSVRTVADWRIDVLWFWLMGHGFQCSCKLLVPAQSKNRGDDEFHYTRIRESVDASGNRLVLVLQTHFGNLLSRGGKKTRTFSCLVIVCRDRPLPGIIGLLVDMHDHGEVELLRGGRGLEDVYHTLDCIADPC